MSVSDVRVDLPDWVPLKWGLPRDQTESLLSNAVRVQPGFDRRQTSEAIGLTLQDIALERVDPPFCCWVSLNLKLRQFDGSEWSSRQGAFIVVEQDFRPAVELLIKKASDQVYWHVWSSRRSDGQLYRDLKTVRGTQADSVIEVLADRKNPAATAPLIELLKSGDPLEVRRAIGHLVEMKALQAVPVLIELARGKNPAFLRELLFALGALGGDEAQAYLYTVAQGHDLPEIRAIATMALEELSASTLKGR